MEPASTKKGGCTHARCHTELTIFACREMSAPRILSKGLEVRLAFECTVSAGNPHVAFECTVFAGNPHVDERKGTQYSTTNY